MSLRTRLGLLAAFAVVALLVALFVAWRLARTTESFVLRHADSSTRAAANDLARELSENPDGYRTIEQILSSPGNRSRENDPHPRDNRERNPPPHVEEAFAAYADPLARLTAITLHRFPDVEGGFYRPTDQKLVGYASENNRTAGVTENISGEMAIAIKAVAAQAAATGSMATRTIQLSNTRAIVAAYPPATEGALTPWTMQRLSYLSGASDWPNLAGLIVLSLSIVAVSGLALITVRDIRSGVNGIETGLAQLKTDLSHEIAAPGTDELAQIALAVNELAATLRANIARQAELEHELAQRERLAALGRVVAGVAHEVRNPLSAIKLKVQLADRSFQSPEKLSDTFKVVISEIERLDLLVRRLLELGRQVRSEQRPVNLCELAQNRAALFAGVARDRNVRITVQPANHLMCLGDPDRLSQVVDNLIQNAIDAMPEGGSLRIWCDAVQGRIARLSFDDTGEGISPADRGRIFEPFHTTRSKGTGLGLAIARAIVEEHGGTIDFADRSEGGTSFTVNLPLLTTPESLRHDSSAESKESKEG